MDVDSPQYRNPTYTVNFFMLRNYEMKDEKYCFVIFTIAKYGRNYIIIGRNIDIVESLSSQIIVIVLVGTKETAMFRPNKIQILLYLAIVKIMKQDISSSSSISKYTILKNYRALRIQ